MKLRGIFSITSIFGLIAALIPASSAYPTPIYASDLPTLLTVRAEDTSHSYDRDRFNLWTDDDHDGCNTRYEVLIQESLTPVTVGASCKLSGGSWISRYDSGTADAPSEIEIDHLVALAEAWRSGAWGWTDSTREKFANDLDVSYALNVASTSANQSKADKDPAEWLPPDSDYICEFVTSWALVKYRWSLTVDSTELDSIQNILSGTCGAEEVVLPTVLAPVTPLPTPGITQINSFPSGNTRIAGPDRYATAVAASQQFAPGVPVVFVANGTNFPDALSAASAAAKLGGPLLLTSPTSLPTVVANELDRLNPLEIYVVGGTGVVSDAVVAEISTYGPVERLGGSNRYETCLKIVRKVFTTAPLVVIATGRNFPDALAATGLAGSKSSPVIIVDGTLASIPSDVINLITQLGPTSIVIAGGTGVVSTGIESQLSTLVPVVRYGGADRYLTAALINKGNFSKDSTDLLFVASGQNFPDALSGSALAGRLGAALFITKPACVPNPVQEAISELDASTHVVLGGTGVVSTAAALNQPCESPSPPANGKPTYPGDSKNCGDFSKWNQAQAWFEHYYPYYGDVANLDADNDLIACESLPGAP